MDEIKEVVFSIAIDKNPGPDGFPFFQKCWDMMKDNLLELFRDFHLNGKISKGLNATFFTLIPKNSGANRIQNFQAISLISAPYKIIANVLSNRISEVLHEVIDGNLFFY